MKTYNDYKIKFLNYLQSLNRSANTITTYNFILDYYQKFLKLKNVKVENYYSLQTIIDYKKYLDEIKTRNNHTNLAESTKNSFIGKLSVFFSYLIDTQIILINPFNKIDKLKTPKKLPKNIPDNEDIKQILRSISLHTVYEYRDRTIFELVYSTGIRRMEIINLSIYDIDLNNGFIRIIKGKGAKDRIVPIGKIACDYLKKYINEIRPQLLKCANPEQFLFVGQTKKKMSLSAVARIFRTRIAQSNIKKKFSCHSFRHACATEMLKGKASIRHVQEMLGHSCLSSTQIYTQVQPVDLLEVHKKTHPSWNLFENEDKKI